MANLITPQLEAPPDTVEVLVDFYDALERQALLASPMREAVKDLPRVIPLRTQDLLTYYLYYKKQPGSPKYSSHANVALQWANALSELDGLVEFSGGSIRVLQGVSLDRGTTEKLGEALGLAVASELHNLHLADWSRIPESNKRKTLDFWYPCLASDSVHFIQVEAKGSGVDNNDRKPSTVSHHKASIQGKKRAAPSEERQSSVLYGTIGVVDDRRDSTARCWLVDPPVGEPDNPDRFKIVSRLSFIIRLMSLISPRSVYASSAQTRLAALESLPQIEPLDRKPLRRGSGSDLPAEGARGRHHPFFNGRSVVTDGPTGGDVNFVRKDVLLFTGMREELVTYAVSQSFARIRDYSFPSGSLVKTVRCVVPYGRFDRDFSRRLKGSPIELSRAGGYVSFELGGLLHYTRSGLVVGVLPVPRSEQKALPEK